MVCNEIDGASCDVGQYCDYRDNLCGAGEDGVCKKSPTSCKNIMVGVKPCACDGQQYLNKCTGKKAGYDFDASNGCSSGDEGGGDESGEDGGGTVGVGEACNAVSGVNCEEGLFCNYPRRSMRRGSRWGLQRAAD